jgi:ribose transport system ATP-binding protein
LWRFPFLRRSLEPRQTRYWFERLAVRPVTGMDMPLSAFSGGNQQKVLLAKWLSRAPRVLLVDEPTQGVDIGARAKIHQELLDSARQGSAVVISSSDIDELVALCHRILVLRAGRVAATLSGGDLTVTNISKQTLASIQEVTT